MTVQDAVLGQSFTVWDTARLVAATGGSFPTCSGGYDKSKCNVYYSEVQNQFYCPLTNPVRFPVAVQVPSPLFRPTPQSINPTTTGVASSVLPAPLNFSEYFTGAKKSTSNNGKSSTTSNVYPTSIAAPFLYIASGATAQTLAANMGFVQPSLNTVSQLNATVRQYLSGTALLVANRLSELFPLIPIQPFLLGTGAQLQQGQAGAGGGLSTDAAWSSYANPSFAFLLPDCSALSAAQRATLSAAGFAFTGGFSSLFSRNTTSSPPLSCVSMPPIGVISTSVLNTLLFTGYGKGAPGSVGQTANISQYAFAVDFGSTNPAPGSPSLSATLLYNGSEATGGGRPHDTFFRVNGPLNRLSNAFMASLLGRGAGAVPAASMRYVRDMPSQGTSVSLDIGSFLGPLFYTWLAQLLFPVMVGLLVYEKEKNLRTMMRVQGLGDGAYLLVNYGYYYVLYFAYLLLMYFYGYILGVGTHSLSLWTRSSPGPVVVFFLLFINMQIGLAFLFQAVFANAKTATVFSVVFLLIGGLLGKFLFEPFLESSTFPRSGIVGMELLMAFTLYRGFYEMAAFGAVAAFNPKGQGERSLGITWNKIKWSNDYPGGMSVVMVIFLIEGIIIHLLAYYLDQVYSSGSGIKRHPLFFLEPILRKQLEARQAGLEAASDRAIADAAARNADAADVVACRQAAYAVTPGDRRAAILARGLSKTYPGQDGAPPKVACRELSLAIPAGECFGLLGPNGAGAFFVVSLTHISNPT